MPTWKRPSRAAAAPWLAAAVCAILGIAGSRPGRAETLPEYEIKAAFVYNFARFVQWPAAAFPRPESPLLVCVIGRDPFGPALDAIDRKPVQGHELRVRRQVDLDGAKSCHVLFVAESEHTRVAAILRAVSGASVLTVSDMDHFAEMGGVIGLYNAENRVAFSVNLDEAARALLQINSQLLKLAKIVQLDSRKEGR